MTNASHELLLIARKLLAEENLATELNRRIEAVINAEPNPAKTKELLAWVNSKFNYDISRGPKGFKPIKDAAVKFFDFLKDSMYADILDKDFLPRLYKSTLADKLDDFVKFFSLEANAGKMVKEFKVGEYTFINGVNFNPEDLKTYSERMAKIFDDVKGWRRKAFTGGLTVVFAGPSKFRGTAGGKYSQSDDILYLRATPKVLQRGSGYGSSEYILVHELGHRYENKNSIGSGFDANNWATTRYSYSDGEAFAELFALSNFGITSLQGKDFSDVIGRFEKIMAS